MSDRTFWFLSGLFVLAQTFAAHSRGAPDAVYWIIVAIAAWCFKRAL